MAISKRICRHLRLAAFTLAVVLAVLVVTSVNSFLPRNDNIVERSSSSSLLAGAAGRKSLYIRAKEPDPSSESPTESSAGDVKSFRASDPTLLIKREFEAGNEPKRMIFIGDIHGCVDQFNSLLDELKFQQGEDQIVLVGDLVAKGPESLAVIQKASSIGAWCVRGNHDDRVIRWREFLDGPGKGMSKDELSQLEDSGGLPYDDFKVSKEHYDIAGQLTAEELEFLQSFSVIMAPPPPYTEWIVVHGGLEAQKPVLNQTADTCMTIRNVAATGPISTHDQGVAWFDIWAAKMQILEGLPPNPLATPSDSTEEDYNNINFNKIIYGHDAGRGLQIHDYTKGLDSRCVYGGNLTAFILPGEQLVSVPCVNYDDKAPD
ncbi:hypothetical protein EV178_005334 [Coemansia sp. RSA 1646]|nr:hypothetical protein EV178_005334 [Coemansia sp. RSA 1646]KAJ2086944.1 hypothetical protein IW138_005291 [Coemansia sp. RSA 986]